MHVSELNCITLHARKSYILFISEIDLQLGKVLIILGGDFTPSRSSVLPFSVFITKILLGIYEVVLYDKRALAQRYLFHGNLLTYIHTCL